jgi:hypothetical protein
MLIVTDLFKNELHSRIFENNEEAIKEFVELAAQHMFAESYYMSMQDCIDTMRHVCEIGGLPVRYGPGNGHVLHLHKSISVR